MRIRSITCAAVLMLVAALPSAAQFASDRITVVTRGVGPDIILVPGLASHRDVWAGVAGALEDRYRLHLVQVKGFAGLPAEANADGPVSAPVAEEIARYIRESRLPSPTVIGHSMGGVIGMMVAARHPDIVGRLMVVDEPPYLGGYFASPDASADDLRRAADNFRARILADTAGSPQGVLEQMFAGMTSIDSMKPLLLRGVRESNRTTAANAFHELIITDMRPELGRIVAPLVVLYAVPSEAGMPADRFDGMMRELWSNAPNARLVRIDDSEHFVQFDQPGRLIAEIEALMKVPAR